MWSTGGYTKLFGSLIGSTIWRECDATRIVWITMLAMSDKDGRVEASVPGLADFARVSVEATRAALVTLSAPDADSRSTEHDGRRIEAVDGGWRLLNHAKYRAKLSAIERREYQTAKQAEYRAAAKASAASCGQTVDNVDKCSAGVDSVDTYRYRSRSNGAVRAQVRTDTPKPAPAEAAAPALAFVEFWSVWPDAHRVGKKQAEAQWRLLTAEEKARAVAGVRYQVAHNVDWRRPRSDGRWAIPHPWRWLRDRRFDDVQPAAGGRPAAPERPGVWGSVWDELSMRLSTHDLHTWFGPATLVRDDGDVLVVEVVDHLAVDQITRRFAADLAAAVEAARPGARVQLQVA